MKFDPLLAHLTPFIGTGLAAPKEEDDYLTDLELILPKQNFSEANEDQYSPRNSVGSNLPDHDHSNQQLLSIEDDMSVSVDIMKDISIDNKTSDSNHTADEENKLRLGDYRCSQYIPK